MLYITTKNGERIWHTGEPIPPIKDYVVKFQADGHELDVILRALEATRKVPTSFPVDPKAPHV